MACGQGRIGAGLRNTVAAGAFAAFLVPCALAASEVALLHDIPAGHVRLPYFDALAARIGGETGLKVVVNPGQKIFLGKAGLDAVRNGTAPMGLVNTAHLEAVSPQ